MSASKKIDPDWKVHTPRLLEEVLKNKGASVLRAPVNIFGNLLAAVGERAIELNDPQLNALMCRLTIYTIADPESPDYAPDILEEIYRKASAE